LRNHTEEDSEPVEPYGTISVSGVKEAKRMLEDKVRKEKREIRKPLLNTPARKRNRQEGWVGGGR
jgi:hypothetical protein